MFSKFAEAVYGRYNMLAEGELYVVTVNDLYASYLAAFPEGTNPMFRVRTYHDCQTCKQFIRRLGNVVGIQNNKIVTLWEGLDLPHPYNVVAEKMNDVVKSGSIKTIFRTKERLHGTEYNYDTETGERYDHLHGETHHRHYHADAATVRGERESVFQVFKRGLTQIGKSEIETVVDLINSNSLYRGEEHRPALNGFLDLLKKYYDSGRSDLFVWSNLNHPNARFRNTVIGTLLVDLAEGIELEQAVKSFETKVAPMNYKRTTSLITQKMVEDAVSTLNKLNLGAAVYRRYAKLSDVSVNDVLFVDNDTRGLMKDGVTALLEQHVTKGTPDLKRATKIAADEFIATKKDQALSEASIEELEAMLAD